MDETVDKLAFLELSNPERTDTSLLAGDEYRELSSASPMPTLKNFYTIVDRFTSLAEVRGELKKENIEDCGLIFGIDYTLSNRIQGEKTFGGRNLHTIRDDVINPYQEVIYILGETIDPLNSRKVSPAYGFGDRVVKDKGIFPLKGDGTFEGFGEVLDAYNEVTPNINLGGPTNFAPIIREAIQIVEMRKQFHILVIVADGQVTDEEDTTNAIVEASRHALSIVVIGVGDGPWEVMKEYDDALPQRQFDNFQFVDFHKVKDSARNPQAAVALASLMEIPDQYNEMKRLGLLK